MTDEWIGKQFDIISESDKTRVIGLTLALAGNGWTAVDPRGIINPDAGNWQSATFDTVCLASGKSIIGMVGCSVAHVVVGVSGVADVSQAASEHFKWYCTKFIK